MSAKMKKKMEQHDEEAKKALAAAATECAADEDEDEMAAEADAAAMAAEGDEAEMAYAAEDAEKFDDAVHVDIGSHSGEEEEEEEEMEAAYGGKAKMSKGDKSTKALFARVQELERQLRLERFGKEVDAMIRDGYRCGKFRNSMVEELSDAANPSAKIAFWKATMARLPLNVPTVAQHTVTDEAHESMDIKAATARAVHEAAGDLNKFKSLFAKYSGNKA